MSLISQPWSSLAAGDPVDAVQMQSFLNTIRTDYNGNIDNNNIAAGANIDAAKLLDASILTAKLANNAVTSAKIGSGEVKESNLLWTGTGAITALRASTTLRKVIRGTTSISVVTWGVNASRTVSQNFTAGDDTPSNFTATARLVPVLRHTEGRAMTVHVTALSTTSVTFEVHMADAVARAITNPINIDWIAIGGA